VAAPGVGHPSSFSPFIAIFRDAVIMRVLARMVARVARRERAWTAPQLVGTHSSEFHFPPLAAVNPGSDRLR